MSWDNIFFDANVKNYTSYVLLYNAVEKLLTTYYLLHSSKNKLDRRTTLIWTAMKGIKELKEWWGDNKCRRDIKRRSLTEWSTMAMKAASKAVISLSMHRFHSLHIWWILCCTLDRTLPMQLSRFLTNLEKSIGKQLYRAYACYEAQRRSVLLAMRNLSWTFTLIIIVRVIKI